MPITVGQMLNGMAGQYDKAQQQGAAKQPLDPKAKPGADGTCPTCGQTSGASPNPGGTPMAGPDESSGGLFSCPDCGAGLGGALGALA